MHSNQNQMCYRKIYTLVPGMDTVGGYNAFGSIVGSDYYLLL